MASEAGVLDIDPAKVVRKGRLQPGRMFLVDTARAGSSTTRRSRPRSPPSTRTRSGCTRGWSTSSELPQRERDVPTHETLRPRASRSSATPTRSCKIILAPMARTGYEPIGSMGTDTPIAVLSDRPRLLFDYFQQLFAQVTNPPLDAIREELVTSLRSTIGPEGNLLEPGPAVAAGSSCCPSRSSSNDELAKIIHINQDGDLPGSAAQSSPACTAWPAAARPCKQALEQICAEVSRGDRRRRPDHRALRPRLGRGLRADPVAAAHRRRSTTT